MVSRPFKPFPISFAFPARSLRATPSANPNPLRLHPRDVRDGRVLLACFSLAGTNAIYLSACDPLYRTYVLLPPIPEETTVQQESLVEFGTMLAPTGEDEDETSFKVIHAKRYKSKLVAFVFSCVTGQWCLSRPLGVDLSRFNCLHGCFYWKNLWRDKLLVLDTRIMEFSTVNILTGYHLQLINKPGENVCSSTIVDGTAGALEMLTLVRDNVHALFYLCHTTQQNSGESSNEWQLKNVIALPRRHLYSIVGATEGFLFLQGDEVAQDNAHRKSLKDNVVFLSLDVKTSELKKVSRLANFDRPNRIHSYFGFPPSLSKQSL
ncbi:hypothetical protein VPH35_115778 [Triticum aestivum]